MKLAVIICTGLVSLATAFPHVPIEPKHDMEAREMSVEKGNLASGKVLERDALQAPDTDKKPKCAHGWCGAPFCYPECGPHGSSDEVVERGDPMMLPPPPLPKCHRYWCGAPFCSPEFGPVGCRGGGGVAERDALPAPEDEHVY